MILFLTSSPTGPLDGSRPVDGLDKMNYLVDNLKKYWKKDARNLMITATPDNYEQNDEMIEFFANAVKKDGFTWSAFDLWDRRTEDISWEMLHSYDVIWLGGGHVPTQNQYFKELNLRDKLKGFKGIVIGISAGTMNSADVVYAQPEHPGESVDPAYERFIEGLGLTRTMILPHYQMVKDYYLDGKRLYEDITYGDSYGKEFLVLPDGSYLMSEAGKESVWGEAYQIKDGMMVKISQENDIDFVYS